MHAVAGSDTEMTSFAHTECIGGGACAADSIEREAVRFSAVQPGNL